MSRGFTAEEREWLIDNYRILGPKRIGEMYGKPSETVRWYVSMMRRNMKAAGDERWKVLSCKEVGWKKARREKDEVIKNYGVVKCNFTINGKYGICPPWLVINDKHFDDSLQQIHFGRVDEHQDVV
jgi:hypothetical protein